IKIVMTYTLPSLMKSPSGAAFGSVLGLMAFFYFFARLTLFCADGGAATARRSRRKADSWRRWKSPGQSIATSVSATQCCSG
ncbi:hypothetical protein QU845_25165, partial [Escherichia coli]|nr:hypothetical protein [Escherichia coli]